MTLSQVKYYFIKNKLKTRLKKKPVMMFTVANYLQQLIHVK